MVFGRFGPCGAGQLLGIQYFRHEQAVLLQRVAVLSGACFVHLLWAHTAGAAGLVEAQWGFVDLRRPRRPPPLLRMHRASVLGEAGWGLPTTFGSPSASNSEVGLGSGSSVSHRLTLVVIVVVVRGNLCPSNGCSMAKSTCMLATILVFRWCCPMPIQVRFVEAIVSMSPAAGLLDLLLVSIPKALPFLSPQLRSLVRDQGPSHGHHCSLGAKRRGFKVRLLSCNGV